MKNLFLLPVTLFAALSMTLSVQAVELLKPVNVDTSVLTQQAKKVIMLEMQTLNIETKATEALLSVKNKLNDQVEALNPQRKNRSNFALNLAE